MSGSSRARSRVYRELAERAWVWVLAQVRRGDDGLWLPEDPAQTEPGEYPYGMHSGVGGLAHVLAEIRLTRGLTADEAALGDGIARPWSAGSRTRPSTTTSTGWSAPSASSPRSVPPARTSPSRGCWSWPRPTAGAVLVAPPARCRARCNDVTLGTAGVLLGALWALRYDVPGAAELAARAADLLSPSRSAGDRSLLAVRPAAVPARARGRADAELVARAGRRRRGRSRRRASTLDRPDLVDAARPRRRAPAHPRRHQRRRPAAAARDPGPGGPRHLHLHVVPRPDRDLAAVRGARPRRRSRRRRSRTPSDWERACLHSLRVSGHPRATPSRLLGQRRPLLRYGGRRRRRAQRLAAARPSRRTSPSRSRSADAIVERAMTERRPHLLALRRAPQRGSAAAAGAGLDAGRRRDRGVPLPPGPGARAGPRRRRPSPAWTPGGRCRAHRRRTRRRARRLRATPDPPLPVARSASGHPRLLSVSSLAASASIVARSPEANAAFTVGTRAGRRRGPRTSGATGRRRPRWRR